MGMFSDAFKDHTEEERKRQITEAIDRRWEQLQAGVITREQYDKDVRAWLESEKKPEKEEVYIPHSGYPGGLLGILIDGICNGLFG